MGQVPFCAAVSTLKGIDYYELPVGLENIVIVSDCPAPIYAHKPHVNLFTKNGQQLTGINPGNLYRFVPADPATWPNGRVSRGLGRVWWDDMDATQIIDGLKNAGLLNSSAYYDGSLIRDTAGSTIHAGGTSISIMDDLGYLPGQEEIRIDKVTDDLVFLIGGHSGAGSVNCNHYSLKIYAEFSPEFRAQYIDGAPITQDSEKTALIDITTQEKAQQALVKIDDAIVAKDKARAHIGALQNRLENTVTNITIQAENLQSAESRISDADIAQEMTEFVRNQILTQSAVAMLGQANSFPHMMMSLLNR